MNAIKKAYDSSLQEINKSGSKIKDLALSLFVDLETDVKYL